MKLFEYQAKELFQEAGIGIPKSYLIEDVSHIEAAIEKTGTPCVLKSQVLKGGRGKAGLIQFADGLDAAYEKANLLFKSPHHVNRILIEEAIDIHKELYVSITVDPVESKVLIMACREGGVDIESIAIHTPDKIIMEKVDITSGIQPYHCRNMAYSLGLDGQTAKQVMGMIEKLYHIFKTYDAELVEVNPLFVTKDGHCIAGDGKISLDDNAMYRQKTFTKTRDYFESDIEYEAALEGIPYIQFDGDISLMCAGAGLTTTVYDLIHDEGGTVANYLEFGGPNYRKAKEAMELCLSNQSKVILIVTFGTIARADVMAKGVVEAIKKLQPDRPIVTCIRGTNEQEAVKILSDAGLECIFDTEEAVRKAVAIAEGRALS